MNSTLNERFWKISMFRLHHLFKWESIRSVCCMLHSRGHSVLLRWVGGWGSWEYSHSTLVEVEVGVELGNKADVYGQFDICSTNIGEGESGLFYHFCCEYMPCSVILRGCQGFAATILSYPLPSVHITALHQISCYLMDLFVLLFYQNVPPN